jgi:hypothetical protein
MDAALIEVRQSTSPNIAEIARKHSVHVRTLQRHAAGSCSTRQQKAENQYILSVIQQKTLVDYINKLSKDGIPPTPSMVLNFAADIAGKRPSKGWVPRFTKKWSSELQSRYLRGYDLARKKADNKVDLKAYFELARSKMQQYEILPENTYNMDEKGFMLGILNKSKRIFSRSVFEAGELRGTLQDGNREWITCIASICADGTSLPPALIYKADTGNLMDTWVEDLDCQKHLAFFTSSPTGWTNDKIGYDWLTEVFERFTQPKARLRWRLLVVDGHGSHINMRFLQWAIDHKILVLVYPPHSTHRLQPLDVALFSPLSTFYSHNLDQFIADSQGLSSISKRDFFRLFWSAYTKSFTEANINSGWQQTGLYPFNPHVVLGEGWQLEEATTDDSRPSTASLSSNLSDTNWRKARAVLYDVVREALNEQEAKKVNMLENLLLRLQAQNSILRSENEGLRRAITHEKKRRKRGKHVFEELRAQDGHGATWFSPQKISHAIAIQEAKEIDKQEAIKAKSARADAQRAAKQLMDDQRAAAAVQRRDTAAAKKVVALQQQQQRAKAREASQASQQLQQHLQQSAKKPQKRSLIVVLKIASKVALKSLSSEKANIQPAELPVRIRRPPRRFNT